MSENISKDKGILRELSMIIAVVIVTILGQYIYQKYFNPSTVKLTYDCKNEYCDNNYDNIYRIDFIIMNNGFVEISKEAIFRISTNIPIEYVRTDFLYATIDFNSKDNKHVKISFSNLTSGGKFTIEFAAKIKDSAEVFNSIPKLEYCGKQFRPERRTQIGC